MSLIELTLEGKIDRVQVAIERLRTFEPPEGYYLAFSGGKDSQCIYEIAKLSGVKFDAHFNVTTVDPPELLRFIRDNYPDVKWERPEMTMWELIVKNRMPPTRLIRYCCSYLKEHGGADRFVITGVRAAESAKRKNRAMVDTCYKKNKKVINPIIDWSDKDVWEFIRQQELSYCSIYNEGYKRIGCVMCPMQNTKGMLKDKVRYPNFYKAYLKAFGKMIEYRKRDGLETMWDTAQQVMDWWIYQPNKGKNKDQIEMKYFYE